MTQSNNPCSQCVGCDIDCPNRFIPDDKPPSPLEIIITSLDELATKLERDWTRDGTTLLQDDRYRLAASHIRQANMLLSRNNEEFKRGE